MQVNGSLPKNGMLVDILYHFGMTTETHNFHALFGDVKLVLCGGSAKRMERLANTLAEELGIRSPTDCGLKNLCLSDRYVMFKAGPVLCVNHGIGAPSLLIMLHELVKLLRHARCKDITIIRVGTSGGIGLPPGTVVVTEQALNGCLQPFHEMEIIGQKVAFPTNFDANLCNDLYELALSLQLPAVKGKTMCSNDFYEGQGRLDGAICSYTKADQLAFLMKANSLGVTNIEMESSALAAFAYRAGIKAGLICVTLVNRLTADQLTEPITVLKAYEDRPCKVLIAFIKKHLKIEMTNGVHDTTI